MFVTLPIVYQRNLQKKFITIYGKNIAPVREWATVELYSAKNCNLEAQKLVQVLNGLTLLSHQFCGNNYYN